VQVLALKLLKIKIEEVRLKLDMLKTFLKEKCQRLIGQIKLNGKENKMPQGKGTYGKVKGRPPKKGVKKIGKKKPMRRGLK